MAESAVSFVIVRCLAGAERCAVTGPLDPAREAPLRAALDEALAALSRADFTFPPRPIPVAVDAALPDGVLALVMPDAGAMGFTAHAGQPLLMLADGGLAQVIDRDLLLHELVHVWQDTHGDRTPRWVQHRGVADLQGQILSEGVADFVVAALTGDPVIAEASTPDLPTHRVDIVVRCPEGLVGFSYEDGGLVSGALWALGGAGRDAAAMAVTLDAVRQVGPTARELSTYNVALAHALETRQPNLPNLVGRWAEIVAERRLNACVAPIPVELGGARVSARVGEFVAHGAGHFAEDVTEIASANAFRAWLEGARHLRLVVRSSRQTPPLEIAWQTTSIIGEVVGDGRLRLQGWPSQHVEIVVPGGDWLTVRMLNTAEADASYNDLALERVEEAPRATVAHGARAAREVRESAAGGSGCALDVTSPLVALVAGLVLWRARRAGSRDQCRGP